MQLSKFFFSETKTNIFKTFFFSNDTRVIVVASSRDAHSKIVYPTHPYNLKQRNFPNLTFLPDPSIISINGIIIGLTSTDVIGHLTEVELAQ